MTKPHLAPRYDCPPGNVYLAWDPCRDREVITINPRDLRLAQTSAAIRSLGPMIGALSVRMRPMR